MQWSDVSFTDRTLRQFAFLWLIVFAALGLWRILATANIVFGVVLLALALTLGPLGLAWPQLIRPVYAAWMAAVFPIGWVVSNLLLAVVYFLMFAPLALAFRLLGRDPLRRRRGPRRESHWGDRRPADPAAYLRQF